jgi:exosortase/archaeosortase family protein
MGKNQHLRFPVIMTVFMGVVVLFYSDDVVKPVFGHLSVLTAQATLMLLHWSGLEAMRVANQIFHPGGFVYEIYYRCTGILPMALFATAVLAYRAPLRLKLAGLAGGLPILAAINLIRLVHLFYVGVNNRAAFETIHSFLWQPAMMLMTFVLWYCWKKAASNRTAFSKREREGDIR